MLVVAKAAVPLTLGIFGSVVAATTENTTIAVGTTLAVIIGFAGLLIQQVIQNQRAVWAIVEAKNADNEALRDELHEKEYRLAILYHRLDEGPDPGPFVPRPRRNPHA